MLQAFLLLNQLLQSYELVLMAKAKTKIFVISVAFRSFFLIAITLLPMRI